MSELCAECHGLGRLNLDGAICPICQGNRVVVTNGIECGRCHGSGSYRDKPCPRCRATGWLTQPKPFPLQERQFTTRSLRASLQRIIDDQAKDQFIDGFVAGLIALKFAETRDPAAVQAWIDDLFTGSTLIHAPDGIWQQKRGRAVRVISFGRAAK